MVLSTHGGFFHTSFAKRLKQIYFHTITRCSLAAYHTVIPSSAQDSAHFAPIRCAGLVTVENGVEIEKFAGLANPAARVMLYFGRIAPNKEIPQLIRWFAAFHRAAPDWTLIIAGKATGVSWETLKALADEQKVAGSVEFHDTPDDATLADLISRSSVYVCASSYEGFGIAAVEAASSGLFPVLSNIGPFERTVERTGLGMVVDFAAPPEVDRLVANWADHRQNLSQPSLANAVAPFGWAAKHLQILDIYAKTLKAGKQPASEAIA
jgi:alpha-1,3-mannosyltransferase